MKDWDGETAAGFGGDGSDSECADEAVAQQLESEFARYLLSLPDPPDDGFAPEPTLEELMEEVGTIVGADRVAARARKADPGVETALMLEALARCSLSPAGLLDAVCAAERMASWVQAAQHRHLAAFAKPGIAAPEDQLAVYANAPGQPLHQQSAKYSPNERGQGDRTGVDSDLTSSGSHIHGDPEFSDGLALAAFKVAAAEVSAALLVSPIGANRRVAQAVEFMNDLPATLTALQRGTIDRGRSMVILDRTQNLPSELRKKVEAIVLPKAITRTAGRIRGIVDRAVIAADPEAAKKRQEIARRNRGVSLRAGQDGMSQFRADLSAENACTAYNVIDQIASINSRNAAEHRPINALRADVFAGIFDQLADYGSVHLHTVLGRVDGGGDPRRPCPIHPAKACDDPISADASSGAATADSAGTEHAASDRVVLDSAVPGNVVPNRVVPDGVVPDSAVPDGVVPDGVVPDNAVPDSAVPDCSGSDGAMSANQSSDSSSAPTVPDCAIAAVDASECRVPDAADSETPRLGDCGPIVVPSRWHGTSASGYDLSDTDVGDPVSAATAATPVDSTVATVNDRARRTGSLAGTALPARRLKGQIPNSTAVKRISTAAVPDCGCYRAASHSPAPAWGLGTHQGRTTGLNVTIAATTLAGLDDLPGELDGHGTIPADMARGLAASAATITAVAVDPACGTALDLGRTVYRPRLAQRDYVVQRDQTCRFPSCRQPSWRCQLDHSNEFCPGKEDSGVTCPCNLICLCKFHHDLKTFGLWDPEYQPDGSVTWNSPTGREYTVQTREWPTGLADVRTTRETEGPTNESDGASEITRDRRRHPDIAGKAAASEDGSPGREVPPVDDVEPPF